MKGKKTLVLGALALLVVGFTIPSPAQAQSRIIQQIVVNGQATNGAYMSVPGGGMQTFTCDYPQQYTIPNGAAQGWACYDGTTGLWLLNAVPPGVTQAPVVYESQPAVVYQRSPVVVYRPTPVVVYSRPVRRVVVAPAYSPSVVLGAAAINTTGRIVASAIERRPVIVRAPVVVRRPVEWHGHDRDYFDHHRRG